MSSGAVVPHEDSFLIVGGENGSGDRLDTIYKYEVATDSWTLLQATLPNPTSNLKATSVEMSIFPASK